MVLWRSMKVLPQTVNKALKPIVSLSGHFGLVYRWRRRHYHSSA